MVGVPPCFTGLYFFIDGYGFSEICFNADEFPFFVALVIAETEWVALCDEHAGVAEVGCCQFEDSIQIHFIVEIAAMFKDVK